MTELHQRSDSTPASPSSAAATVEPMTWGVRGALLAMVVFFGGSLPAYKLASDSFGPATTNLIRFSIASAMLLVIGRKHLRVERSQLRHLVLIGMSGIGLMAAFMAVGVDKGSATIASIVVGLEPIGVALAGVWLIGDKASGRQWMALAVGFLGALVASGVFTEHDSTSPVLLPIVLLLGTVITFSIYTARVRRASQGIHPLGVAAITQAGALLVVIPACMFDLFDRGMVRGDVTPKALGGALFLGFGSAIAYLVLCLVLARQPSNRVAIAMYLTPLFGVIFSWLVVGEPMHWRNAVGGAIVLFAIWLSEGRRPVAQS